MVILSVFKKAFLTSLLIAAPILANATGGGAGPGGGDLQCDAKIQDITKNIQTWITNQGERSGQKLDLSSSSHPLTHAPYSFSQYETAMLELLKKPVDANCVGKGNSRYPVEVGDATKICKTFVDTKRIHMLCDRELFIGLSDDDKIKQVHHELAINVEGLEPDKGSISTYKISKQLSAFIDNVSERRLVVMTAQPKKYVQVVTCKTLKGPEVGPFLDPRAIDYLQKNHNFRGIAGGQESENFSFSVNFMDDQNTITQLFSKNWPWTGVVPVLIANDQSQGPPITTKLVHAEYNFISPVQLMKVNGENYVKAATFAVRSKIETYHVDLNKKLEEASNANSSSEEILLEEQTKYRAGLIDSEIICELRGLFL